MSFFKKQNYQIHFEEIKNSSQQNILFMHGNLSSNVWWEPTIELWKKENIKGPGSLVFAEWRGCGQSTGPETIEDLRIEKMATDYIDLIESLGWEKTHLVGHSTGGIIVLKALTLKPDLFDKVLLLDPVVPWGFQAPPELMAAFDQMKSDKNFCAVVMGSTIHGNNPESTVFKKIVDAAFGVSPLIWRGIPEVLSQVNFRDELPMIKNETLILHGEHDPVLSKKDSEELVGLLKNSRYVELKNQGHSCNIENPSLFVKHLKDFLN